MRQYSSPLNSPACQRVWNESRMQSFDEQDCRTLKVVVNDDTSIQNTPYGGRIQYDVSNNPDTPMQAVLSACCRFVPPVNGLSRSRVNAQTAS